MYSPALITYSFYLDEDSKPLRFKYLNSIDIQRRLPEEKLLNLSRGISAFNFTFGGDSVSIPIADQSDIEYSEMLRRKKGIDVYFAGKNNSDGKSGSYFSGHILAVCLVLSELRSISISRNELLKSIRIINGDDTNNHEFSGFVSAEFPSVIARCNYSFEFLADLKKDLEKSGRRRLFGIF